ncbi:MAG: hypothetical protein AAFX92_23830, partial [Pseudomonadota bacterium]
MTEYGPDGPRIAVLDSVESLGNAVYKFPFLRALKRAYPDSHVTWVVHERTTYANILRDLTRGYVDEVIAHAEIEKPFFHAIKKLRALAVEDVPRFEGGGNVRRRGAAVLRLPGEHPVHDLRQSRW